jgi:hypothetical protein
LPGYTLHNFQRLAVVPVFRYKEQGKAPFLIKRTPLIVNNGKKTPEEIREAYMRFRLILIDTVWWIINLDFI